MAIVNQYKAVYPVKNTRFENEEIYINSTSMEKAVNMITTEKGTEPKIISKIHENVLTEPTSETTVDFDERLFKLDDPYYVDPFDQFLTGIDDTNIWKEFSFRYGIKQQ